MSISFVPALGHSSTVPVCVAYAATAELGFTATLTSQDYEQLQTDGGRVQLWSDFPQSGRSHGDWGEQDFVDIPSSKAGNAISLLSDQTSACDRTLYLRMSVNFTDGEHQHFSYTYRILYPSGEIKWLGAFGHNGFITLQPVHEDVGIELSRDTWKEEDGHRVWESRGDADAVIIGRVARRGDWNVWPFGFENVLEQPTDASLLFLVPTNQGVVIPSTTVFAASPNVTLSIVQNCVIASGNGAVIFMSASSAGSMRTFMEHVLRFSPSSCVPLGYSGGSVILASPLDQSPVSVTIVPLIPKPSLDTVVIEWSKFAPTYVPSTESPVVLFAEQDARTYVYESPSININVLVAPEYGAKFLLSPFYNVEGKNAKLQIAIISPHVLKSNQDDGLPTPPPSPHLVPTVPSRSPFSRPSITSSESSLVQRPPPARLACVMAYLKELIFSTLIFVASFLRRTILGRRQPNTISSGHSTPTRSLEETTPLLHDSVSNEEAMVNTPRAATTSDTSAIWKALTPGLSLELLACGTVSCIVRDPAGSGARIIEEQLLVKVGSDYVKPQNARSVGEGIVEFELGPLEGKSRLSMFAAL